MTLLSNTLSWIDIAGTLARVALRVLFILF